MVDSIGNLGDTAKSLARNPLGIIALFIVMAYGFASLVTAFAGSLSSQERMPLIYFLIFFPVLVLGVFTWLVVNHSAKLYSPSDVGGGENYIKMLTVASLTAATAKGNIPMSEADLKRNVEVVQAAQPSKSRTANGWRNQILWVDDNPDNNIYERQAFEAMGIKFTLAKSTNEAFEKLANAKFAVIISDMGRREGPREGYVLLDRLRKQGDNTPLFFYASSNAREHKIETLEHGGQGCTNNGQELFEMVIRAVNLRRAE
jgi:CheY-like chemotaxis protein